MLRLRQISVVLGLCVSMALGACDGVELPEFLSKDRSAQKPAPAEPTVLKPADKLMKGSRGQSYLNLGVKESLVVDDHEVELVAVKRQKGKLTAMIHVAATGQPKVRHQLHTGDQFLLGERAVTVVLVTPKKFSAEIGGAN